MTTREKIVEAMRFQAEGLRQQGTTALRACGELMAVAANELEVLRAVYKAAWKIERFEYDGKPDCALRNIEANTKLSSALAAAERAGVKVPSDMEDRRKVAGSP